ncbi:MAG: heparan-alpha-glucosaminide N-acetyltransferase domain-containing protein [Halieaceae bacterium]|nr:heparan-alpha-glucosaminide N-acetyltransferase domain-containing protein [Halieaceae bacterium]
MTDYSLSRDARSYRLTSIDMLRGLVVVIMALDHVRDYFLRGMIQDPMAQPDIPLDIYLTRWVTHFCAPVFVFLAGTSAGLMAGRKTPGELGAFLAKRGLWLVFVEVTLISTAFTFAPFDGVAEMGGHTLLGLQVIWAIGASMLLLAALQFLGTLRCAALGAVILLGHDAVGMVWPAAAVDGTDAIWLGLFTQSSTVAGPFLLYFAYPLVPWAGLMLLGFGTAGIFQQDTVRRDRTLLLTGLVMIAAFLVLRALDIYGDPNPWQQQSAGLQATVLDFMNVSKYPPSLLFLLITLGPMAILCAYADRWSGWLKDTLVMFGRVPFAFYIAHWYLLRVLNLLLAMYQGIEPGRMMTFFFFFPPEYGLPLSGVYVVWALVIVLLYPFCRWFAEIKKRRNDWWLSYL